MKINIFWLFLGVLLLEACKPQEIIRDLQGAEVQMLPTEFSETNSQQACSDKLLYAPSEDPQYATPVRTVRVNFHYISTKDSSSNYGHKRGTHFARDIIKQANMDLAQNQPMNLPLRNETPALPTRYRYVLTPDGNVPGDDGVYFHYDDDEDLCFFVHQGKNRNSTRKDLIHKYAVNPDSVLNVFVLPHHPDSVKSRTYSEGQTGIALGTSVKISGILEKKKYQPWLFRGLLNHEIGHVLGLPHAWGRYDGCDDTPAHPNCWHRTKNGSKCDSLNSNNVMDYNMNQNSWTPCQLSRIHYNFAQIGSRQRKLLVPDWCQLDTLQNIRITENVHWYHAKDLSGNIIIEPGASLKLSCRVSLPKGAHILVKTGAHLILEDAWLHNSCGDQWEGIKIAQKGKKLMGKVSFVGKPKLQDMAKELTFEVETTEQ